MASEIERWEPFRELMTLRQRVDHLFDSMFDHGRGTWLAGGMEEPALDMYEADGKIKLDVRLPGVKPEEVELSVSGNTLTIKGERKEKQEVNEKDYYRRETRYGAFTRAVTLPEAADTKQPEAAFEDGVLSVTFPKLAAAEPKRIPIAAKTLEEQHVG